MRVALVNPPWRHEGSIYFGCRDAHLPLELGYAAAHARAAGSQARIFDAALEAHDAETQADAIAAFAPDVTVVTTAPTYLFWRRPPPELASPIALLAALGDRGGRTVAVGPHGSTTPRATLVKLGVDVVVLGECEAVVGRLAAGEDLRSIPSIAFQSDGDFKQNGGPAAAAFVHEPPLVWPSRFIAAKRHHHHRFDAHDQKLGAEVEASRGCPYACAFCAKIDFRDRYRRRRLDFLLAEIDGLIAQGVGYLYFIDEIFLPDRRLLNALAERPVTFGVQTRIDLWKPDMLDALGEAGCVSMEAGVESLTIEGMDQLDKNCRLDAEELAARLVHARRTIAFVQANLIRTDTDDPVAVAHWRARMAEAGIWANDPVPMCPYPGAPDDRRRFGAPDDLAWERAHRDYLVRFDAMSEIQDAAPRALADLEAAARRA